MTAKPSLYSENIQARRASEGWIFDDREALARASGLF